MQYINIKEEELKNKIATDFFSKYDYKIIGNIDFCITDKIDTTYQYLWAESKKNEHNIYSMFAQLFLTCKNELNKLYIQPPKYFGCFDSYKIAFVENYDAQIIFNLNDFDWTERPSNVSEKNIRQIKNHLKNIQIFYFDKDKNLIKEFIEKNFNETQNTIYNYKKIDKNNFVFVYQKWRDAVLPYINVPISWKNIEKQYNIYDRDFFLAELNINDNSTTDITDDKIVHSDSYIIFDNEKYILKQKSKDIFDQLLTVLFKKEGIEAYYNFWKIYKRPPSEEYWNYIKDRQDLLVPQNIREQKGSFFTPTEWVELSQQYLAEVFGINWQNEYYIWDCSAGTGNLLRGLTNKYNIFASTIDESDVREMQNSMVKDRILLSDNVFRFDFLNDDFSLLPDSLQKIINDENKRKKLIIYINPPYAETHNKKNPSEFKTDVHRTKTQLKYSKIIGAAGNELFAQFLIRIYFEIPNCKIGEFSKLKVLCNPNFKKFRNEFLAKLKKCFVLPAYTFDNVSGKFPIGFKIWDTNIKEHFKSIISDVYNEKKEKIGCKMYRNNINCEYINNWYKQFFIKNTSNVIGRLSYAGNDIQHQNYIFIVNYNDKRGLTQSNSNISKHNFVTTCIYYSVRKVIKPTWINDRDQFLYPNDFWKNDLEFQNDCLAYTLFNTNIRSFVLEKNKYGKEIKISVTNHWIPFTEVEVCAKKKFESHFMVDFINGKINSDKIHNPLFIKDKIMSEQTNPLQFSREAKEVFNSGRELWKYYHIEVGEIPSEYDVNSSLYDIQWYFQNTLFNQKNKRTLNTFNQRKYDTKYAELMNKLKFSLDKLANKIAIKVYEYGFL